MPFCLARSRYLSLTSTRQYPKSLLIERESLTISLVLGFCPQNIERNVAFYKRTNASLLCWYPLKTCRGWYVGFSFSRPSICVSLLQADQITTVSPVNNSSLSLSYNIPASAGNFSTNYIYGDCANAPFVSTAYSTITSDGSTTVSTIAPATTCCSKCEIGAAKVCYRVSTTRSETTRPSKSLRAISVVKDSPQRLNANETSQVQLVYWQPDLTDSASDVQPTPYTLVSDNYTL